MRPALEAITIRNDELKNLYYPLKPPINLIPLFIIKEALTILIDNLQSTTCRVKISKQLTCIAIIARGNLLQFEYRSFSGRSSFPAAVSAT